MNRKKGKYVLPYVAAIVTLLFFLVCLFGVQPEQKQPEQQQQNSENDK